MARYFLHLKDSIDEVLDPEGTEMLLKRCRERRCDRHVTA
jgi:hypothetical protein